MGGMMSPKAVTYIYIYIYDCGIDTWSYSLRGISNLLHHISNICTHAPYHLEKISARLPPKPANAHFQQKTPPLPALTRHNSYKMTSFIRTPERKTRLTLYDHVLFLFSPLSLLEVKQKRFSICFFRIPSKR